MNIWFCSDLHINHDGIRRFCNRPFDSVEHMNHELIKKYNNVVKEDDIVYNLGDFGCKTAEERKYYVDQLSGFKILIRGNHDAQTQSMLNAGFHVVLESARLDIDGLKLFLVHRPFDVPKEILEEVDLVCAGHCHNNGRDGLRRANEPLNYDPKILNISCEHTNYSPVSLNWILKNRQKLCLQNQLDKLDKESPDYKSEYGI